MFKIFNTIINNKLKDGFSEGILSKSNKITSLILDIYDRAKMSFLPLPSKIHYLFNLRDVSKIIQGICQASPKTCQSYEQLVKMTVHETWRIFGDKLSTIEDRLFLL